MSESKIRLDILKSGDLDNMNKSEKIDTIINYVKNGNIVLLEEKMDSEEQLLLIERTMDNIDQENFKGIDIETHSERQKSQSLINKILNRNNNSDLTIICSANNMEILQNDNKKLSTLFTVDNLNKDR